MPELPEVTTIINKLKNTSMIGKKIIDVVFYKPKVIKNASVDSFKSFLVNESIVDISRKGKYILFQLTNHKWWVVHLRMEGKLFYQNSNEKIINNFLMVEIVFDNNYVLGYYDSRMFGTFHIYTDDEIKNSKELNKVAIDPLDENFTANYLFFKICKVNRAIKTTIMDQSIVSGIGNIYADEILFASKIHPQSLAKNISLDECKSIVEHSKNILKEAIAHKGTTVFSFKFDPNHTGNYQNFLKVHSRENQECYVCKSKIIKIKVNGRGTYFCPNCQKVK